ncbi:MAG TPA: heparinase II/III family protein [Verrucomicrobiae bacterium]|nr:heparinase II/III family protein [Verrucomicrobiae bacterium]
MRCIHSAANVGAALLAVCTVAGAASAATSPRESSLPWKEANGTRIPVPPAEHPRLYLRAKDVPGLAARMRHPALQPAIERLETLAKRHAFVNIEMRAVQLLLKPEPEASRKLIADALAFLSRTKLADRQDACRETGRAMVTGAIVYDWFHSQLDAEEKAAYRRELIRLAGTLECGYPPVRQGSVTGHSSEGMIMRDMLSAGIAMYDESPEMYDFAAGRFFREHLPARNWLYDGGAYHQGDSYGPYRFGWDTFPLWIFDRLGAGSVYNPAQAQVPYYYIYATRPDGQRLRGGDTFCSSTKRGEPWPIGPGALLAGSYYNDGHALAHFLTQGGLREGEALFELLWRDPELKRMPPDDLPNWRYFGEPFGWMIARTGWGPDTVIAEMKINVYNFCNHQHLDAGAFQIYHKGALAIDSGLYTGSSGQYGSPHCRNYAWRTIAHNSLLIFDPAEKFGRGDTFGNDGGQRLPNGRSEPRDLGALRDPKNGYKTGAVLAHGWGPDASRPDYTLLKGDITAAYGPKARRVVRSFAFLDLKDARLPAALVVFDRVVSADPSFQKSWLLHSIEEPRLEGATAVVDRTSDGAAGRLHLTTLLPAAMTKIGGPGKEFWAAGTNWVNDPRPGADGTSIEPGAWRIEISPPKPAADDLFLVVMQVADRDGGAVAPVARIDTGSWIGCGIGAPSGLRVVLFRKDDASSADPLRFTAAGSGPMKCLVTDLEPGLWRATQAATRHVQSIAVHPDSRAAYFEGPPGEWSLQRTQ